MYTYVYMYMYIYIIYIHATHAYIHIHTSWYVQESSNMLTAADSTQNKEQRAKQALKNRVHNKITNVKRELHKRWVEDKFKCLFCGK